MRWQRCCSLLLPAVLCGACITTVTTPKSTKTTPPITIPTYSEARARIIKAGPVVQKPIEVRANLQGGKKQSIAAGTPAPYTGVLIDVRTAEELAAVKAERDRLRAELEAARIDRDARKIVYEAKITKLSQDVTDAQKQSWWQQNKGVVGLVLGVIAGCGLVIGVLYAVTKGNGIQPTSTAVPVVLKKPALVRW